MRRFRIWVDKQVENVKPVERFIELPDDVTDHEVECAIDDAITDLVCEETDSGWQEIK